MSTKGITFSAPMVRALLAGTKTQTRRLLTSARVFGTPHTPAFTLKDEDLARALQGADRFRHLGGDGWLWESDAFEWQAPAERTGWMAHIGYAPGDRLYVREAWKTSAMSDRISPRDLAPDSPIYFVADDRLWPVARYRQEMHMPRWASRIWLDVSEVRVQRLQDISEEDALAEGIERSAEHPNLWRRGPLKGDQNNVSVTAFPTLAYRSIWEALHTEPGERWSDNPWIVAVSFTVHKGNIDRAV